MSNAGNQHAMHEPLPPLVRGGEGRPGHEIVEIVDIFCYAVVGAGLAVVVLGLVLTGALVTALVMRSTW